MLWRAPRRQWCDRDGRRRGSRLCVGHGPTPICLLCFWAGTTGLGTCFAKSSSFVSFYVTQLHLPQAIKVRWACRAPRAQTRMRPPSASSSRP